MLALLHVYIVSASNHRTGRLAIRALGSACAVHRSPDCLLPWPGVSAGPGGALLRSSPGVSGRGHRRPAALPLRVVCFRGGRLDQQNRARGDRPPRRFRLAGGRGDRAACQQGLSHQDRVPLLRRARREPVRLEEGRRADGGRQGAAPRGGRAGRGRARRRDRVLRCRRLSAAHDARDARPHGRHLSRAAAVLRAVARAGGSLQLRPSRGGALRPGGARHRPGGRPQAGPGAGLQCAGDVPVRAAPARAMQLQAERDPQHRRGLGDQAQGLRGAGRAEASLGVLHARGAQPRHAGRAQLGPADDLRRGLSAAVPARRWRSWHETRRHPQYPARAAPRPSPSWPATACRPCTRPWAAPA